MCEVWRDTLTLLTTTDGKVIDDITRRTAMTMICDACRKLGIEWRNLGGLCPWTRRPHCGATNSQRPEPKPEDESDGEDRDE